MVGMSTTTVCKDSHNRSLNEALVNAFGSYPIGYGIGIVVLPLSLGWLDKDPLVANLAITLVYTAASFIRSYALRRLFLKAGVDDNFIKMGIMMVKKLKKSRKK